MQRSLILLLSLLLPVSASASTVHGVPRDANLATIHMLTPIVGWGTNQTEVLHTADGGRHWQTITPPIPWDRGYSIGYLPLDVIDGHAAWFLAPNHLGSTPATALYVFHTSDAGRTWTHLPALNLGQFSTIAQLKFVDRLHGWIVVIRSAGMSQISFDIYHTVDGGHHWWRTLEELDVSGNHHHIGGGLPELDLGQTFTFSSPTSGWVSGCFCGFGSRPELFFHTADGGHTWRPYTLTLPLAFRPGNASIGTPIFFSRRVAVLPVYLLRRLGSGRYFDAYHTTDGGRTWHGTTPISVNADRYCDQFVDSLHGFVLDDRGLHRTADGGRTWQTSPFGFSRLDLIATDFVTPAVGFTLEGIGATNRSRLYTTTNSGRTWHLLPSALSA